MTTAPDKSKDELRSILIKTGMVFRAANLNYGDTKRILLMLDQMAEEFAKIRKEKDEKLNT